MPRFDELQSILLIATVLIFVAARLWRLTSYGLFGDEVFTLWTAAQDWRSLFSSVVADVVHPPLFYLLLKIWIDIGGQSLLWLKLLPALLSIASIVPFSLFCRELRTQPAAINLALVLMAVNVFLINHAQEIRMYSLLLLMTVSSLWLFARLVNRDVGVRKTQILLCAVNLLLVFTHYYGWVVVALEFAFLLLWRRDRLRSFNFAAALLVLCFSPWLYFVAQASRVNPERVNFVWNQPPAVSELVGYYGNLNGPLSYRWKVFGTALVMLLFLSPVIVWGRRIVRRDGESHEARAFWWLALFAFGPVALAFLASHALPQPVWAFRYLIISAPFYLLLVAAAANRLKRHQVRIGFLALMFGWSTLSGVVGIVERNRIAWEPLVQGMIQTEPEKTNVDVFVTDSNVGNTIQFYLDQAGEKRFHVSFVEGFSSLEGDHYWVAFIRYKHEFGPMPQSVLAGRGLIIGDTIEADAAGHSGILFPVWNRPGPMRGD